MADYNRPNGYRVALVGADEHLRSEAARHAHNADWLARQLGISTDELSRRLGVSVTNLERLLGHDSGPAPTLEPETSHIF